MRALFVSAVVILAGCTGDVLAVRAGLPAVDGGDPAVVGEPPVATPDAAVPAPDAGVEVDAGPSDPPPAVDAGPALVDDAEVTLDTFPPQMDTGATRSITITVHNTGTTTWTKAGGYRLGAIDDSDPLAGVTRVDLADGDVVAPGDSHDFVIAITAPGASGTVTSDWRMLKEGGAWFGQSVRRDVVIQARVPPPPFNLANVVIVSSPNVLSWPVTSQITNVTFSPGNFHIDHTLRGQWPPVVIAPDGTEQEATVWVFFAINGTWYGTGGERLRPNQADKGLTNASDVGPGWLYDPNRWGIMTNYVPQPGELVGFMVAAGSTRSDNHVAVQERTGVVLIPFPADGVTASYPPFAWQE
jgi:hypothetical protein